MKKSVIILVSILSFAFVGTPAFAAPEDDALICLGDAADDLTEMGDAFLDILREYNRLKAQVDALGTASCLESAMELIDVFAALDELKDLLRTMLFDKRLADRKFPQMTQAYDNGEFFLVCGIYNGTFALHKRSFYDNHAAALLQIIDIEIAIEEFQNAEANCPQPSPSPSPAP